MPLGEGQWDIMFGVHASYPFWCGLARTGIEAGYRIRLPNELLGIAVSTSAMSGLPPTRLGYEFQRRCDSICRDAMICDINWRARTCLRACSCPIARCAR